MAKTIDVLREEHANVGRLLKVLEWQLDIFDRAGAPDYDIMTAIADFFEGYPVRCHHPKEDAVYTRLRERWPEAEQAIGDLESEHRTIAERAAKFAEAVRNVLNEAEIPRDAFDRAARGFIEFERRHMAREEDVFFPAALDALSAEDWADIEARLTDERDPLNEAASEGRFKVLRDSIIAWEREDRA